LRKKAQSQTQESNDPKTGGTRMPYCSSVQDTETPIDWCKHLAFWRVYGRAQRGKRLIAMDLRCLIFAGLRLGRRLRPCGIASAGSRKDAVAIAAEGGIGRGFDARMAAERPAEERGAARAPLNQTAAERRCTPPTNLPRGRGSNATQNCTPPVQRSRVLVIH
jgi:hypothetical protein